MSKKWVPPYFPILVLLASRSPLKGSMPCYIKMHTFVKVQSMQCNFLPPKLFIIGYFKGCAGFAFLSKILAATFSSLKQEAVAVGVWL